MELRRRTPAKLRDIYVRRMGGVYPFTEGALLALGVLSRGICRRFIKYVGACSDSFSYHEGLLMGEEDVRQIVTSETVSRDIDLELSSFLRDSERFVALRALEVLGEVGEMNQRGLAGEIDASEATLSRVLRKLERMGWVTRSCGERKEQLVRLALS